jgi:hypothetical protein
VATVVGALALIEQLSNPVVEVSLLPTHTVLMAAKRIFGAMRKITIRASNAIPAGIHSGESTHNQDQSITRHSFKTMNATSNRPVTVEELLSLFISAPPSALPRKRTSE